uniref:hypothetical protein n=1 Tax=Pantoea sp. IMH TaxID=1267600 RepID=UPI0004690C07|nr:hypothetical protein [Pantoea sp. IMH]
MSYQEDFLTAIQRTSRFNLQPIPAFSETSGQIMNAARVNDLNKVLAPVFSGIQSYEQIVGECMPIHLKARSVLEKWLGCPVYYTLGWIDDGSSEGLFRFDDEKIAMKLAAGHQDETLDIHAWLTLPTMEIIDLTLTTTLCILQGIKEGEGGVIVKKADEVTGLSYKPMLIGETYLHKIGVIKNMAWLDMGVSSGK